MERQLLSVKDNEEQAIPVVIKALAEVSKKAEKNYVWLYEFKERVNHYGFDFWFQGTQTIDNKTGREEMSSRAIKLFVNKARKIMCLNLARETGKDLEVCEKMFDEKVKLKKIESVSTVEYTPQVGGATDVLGFINGL
tara:strand:+ start:2296 stop:2709 length:414 start_codon:yes stop_codon:yes gene_type:complete